MGEIMEYKVWESEKSKEGTIWLKDKKACKKYSSNRMITKEEYKKLFPERTAKSIYLRFRHNIPREVGKNMAEVLINKYPELEVTEGVIVREPSEEVKEQWDEILKKIDVLKLELLRHQIPLPAVGRTRKEKESFIETAEQLLKEKDQNDT
jgi:hypothetical protein